ncbi:MAG: nitrate- and nitrite sensing domain-containing protein [Acidimicrobiia bacterium]|nr:nitrate- and nitrite sensing domain-containing protein [Acidimicrobiia bacterium]
MFDKVRIRTKLIAIVAAPLVALLALVGLGVVQRRADAAQASRDAHRIEVTDAAATLAHEMQSETIATVAYLGGREDIRPDKVASHRRDTDRAIKDYRQAVRGVSDLQQTDEGAIQSLDSQLDFLSGLRDQVDQKETDWSEISGQYFIVDDAIQGVIAAFGAGISDPDFAAQARSLGGLASLASASAREGAIFTGVLSEGSFSDQQRNGKNVTGEDLRAKYDDAVETAKVQLAVYNAQASADARTVLRNKLSGPAVDVIQAARDAAPKSAFGERITIDPTLYRRATLQQLDVLRGVETTQARSLIDAAQSQVDSSTRAAQFFLILAICITLMAIVIAGIVSSSITRPLASLTEAVDQVATQQLPRLVESLRNPAEDDVKLVADSVTDIEPGGGVELEHLGQAVTAIQHVAVEVATEQAALLRKGIGDMFVNLARRNQALLDRQIEYIDQLENDEEDPDRLDDLFKLDHMATRMRRNAESLLVLAGAEPARRRGRPVPLADVVRAALGEVEDYTRIDLLTLDDVLVKSGGALDVAHLLSELMENATHFSPPDTRVEIVGHRTRSEGYVVSVTDHGIGMTPDQMADANELLANPPLVGLAMSRSLGFIVIGRLAARVGVSVRLIPSPTGGVTAIVSLPSTVVEDTLPREELDAEPVEADAAAPAEEEAAPPWAAELGIWSTPDSLAEAVPVDSDVDYDEALASLVDEESVDEPAAMDEALDLDEDEGRARREHPSTWAAAPEPPRSGPQARPTAEPGDAPRNPDELPVRRPRGGAAPVETAASEPVGEVEPVAEVVEEPVHGGLFGAGEPSRSSAMPEPLLESSAPEPEPALTPLAKRPTAVDRPPTDGLFSTSPPTNGNGGNGNGNGGNGNGKGRTSEANGAAPAAPRLFGNTDRPPLPMPGTARVKTPQDAPETAEPTALSERTSAGLVRRTPRSIGANERPRPGGETPARGVTTTQRSPEEVRAMLSRFRTGQQQAAGARTERNPFDDPTTDAGNGADQPNEDL